MKFRYVTIVRRMDYPEGKWRAALMKAARMGEVTRVTVEYDTNTPDHGPLFGVRRSSDAIIDQPALTDVGSDGVTRLTPEGAEYLLSEPTKEFTGFQHEPWCSAHHSCHD